MEENTNLKEESKNDIQELFDELFAKELKEKIDEVTEQTSNSNQLLEKLNKLTTQNANIIYDKISVLNDNLEFMGTSDDWGDETLISFLNQLALFIANCKQEISLHTKIIGEDWENETIHKLLDDINSKTIETCNDIDSLQKDILQPEFSKLLKESQKIRDVATSVQSIKTKLEKLSDELTLLNSDTTKITTLIKQVIQSQNETDETQKQEFITIRNSIDKNYLGLIELIELNKKQEQKKFLITSVSFGILAVANIVLLLILLL